MFNRIRLIIAAAVLAALMGAECFAQGNGVITGAVLDAQTGRPIPGVSIGLDKGAMVATTDTEGRFTINATAGTHSLQLRSETHAGVDLEAVVVTAGKQPNPAR